MLQQKQIEERNQRRAGMTIEDRQLEALETIADSMSDIRNQLVSFNHTLAVISRTVGTIKR